jgi:hypothetical protein
MTIAARLLARFAGLDRAHGETILTNIVSGKGKKEAKYNTPRTPATIELWDRHLFGQLGLGIVPITDHATCCFGAIDIDKYDNDLTVLADELSKHQLPLILCRSKSGGAHLYLFTAEPVPAEVMRAKLMEWAVVLGYSGVEVFPKQTRLAGENDVGNWINMPYFGTTGPEGTERYAIAAGGKHLTVEEFLDLADLYAMSLEELKNTTTQITESMGDWWTEAPPCLQSLAARGFGEGGRNDALFNVAVYLRKRFPDDWADRLDGYNQQFMDPPLGHKEVAGVAKNAGKKTYEYKCNEPPIVSACNRQICLTRKCGVGTGDNDPGVVFGPLVKLQTVPPMWIWDVEGARIELTTQELKDQSRCHTKIIEVLNKWPIGVKPKQWSEIIREKLKNVEVVEVPADATPEGQMWALLEDYFRKTPARSRDDLAQGKPWTDPDAMITYFSSLAFKQFLEKERVKVDERQLWTWLRKRGAKDKFFNIKGRGVNTWGVPAFTKQTHDYAIPELENL